MAPAAIHDNNFQLPELETGYYNWNGVVLEVTSGSYQQYGIDNYAIRVVLQERMYRSRTMGITLIKWLIILVAM